VFRAAVEDIALTPEGAAALARFNSGDEIGALAVLDGLRAARDATRKKRAEIESAAEGRRIATLALEARARGKLTTAAAIARYEELTRLKPGVHSDWIELGRLYRDAGRLPNALRAAKDAADTAQDDRDRSVAFNALGDVQVAQDNLAGALESYRASLAIRERLARADAGNAGWQRDLSVSYDRIGDVQRAQGNPAAALVSYRASLAVAERLARDAGNAGWQHDLSVSHNKIGDVQGAQGNLAGALESYRSSLAIAERLVRADAGNAGWQRDLSVSHDRIGNVQRAQGNLAAALESYRASLAIRERLARADASNAGWQRDLIVSYVKLSEVTGDKAYAVKALDVVLAMQWRGILTPRDAWMIEELKRRAGR
jgi:tetratricopeptide (TPR) repeat protein